VNFIIQKFKTAEQLQFNYFILNCISYTYSELIKRRTGLNVTRPFPLRGRGP